MRACACVVTMNLTLSQQGFLAAHTSASTCAGDRTSGLFPSVVKGTLPIETDQSRDEPVLLRQRFLENGFRDCSLDHASASFRLYVDPRPLYLVPITQMRRRCHHHQIHAAPLSSAIALDSVCELLSPASKTVWTQLQRECDLALAARRHTRTACKRERGSSRSCNLFPRCAGLLFPCFVRVLPQNLVKVHHYSDSDKNTGETTKKYGEQRRKKELREIKNRPALCGLYSIQQLKT